MNRIMTKQERKIIRTKCPFYGFGTGFLDTSGNQCPLKEGHSPCDYRIKDADWIRCHFNKKDSGLLESLKDCQVFPREFKPENGSSWEGIKFGNWADYILYAKPIPGF